MNKNGLLNQLSDEDKAKVREWAENAKKPKHTGDIPPELFIAAKLGFYYGWEAKVAFARGYEIGIDDDGKFVKLPYDFEHAVADVRAAEKVRYREILDNAKIMASANVSSRDSSSAKSMIDYSNHIRKEVYG